MNGQGHAISLYCLVPFTNNAFCETIIGLVNEELTWLLGHILTQPRRIMLIYPWRSWFCILCFC
jgi:hypothetical protein